MKLLFCPKCHSIYSVAFERCGIDGERLVEGGSDPLVGTSVDRYRIVRRLGAGAMGCVYVAAHTAIDREFALKVLFGEMASNREVADRFRREARSLSKMEHPNIVSVVDFGTTSAGLLYLVMELIRGETLAEAIKASEPHGGLGHERAANIVRQIAAGLAEAHKLGFVHRDLKPGNVMILTKSGDEFAKILDFGMVGIVSMEEVDTAPTPLTRSGFLLGTPAYMSPEQIRHPSVGPSADLYALGAILYEMLSGRRVFSGTMQEVFAKKLSQRAPPLRSDGPLERLALLLLDIDPKMRPGSALSVIAEIDRWTKGGVSAPDRALDRSGLGPTAPSPPAEPAAPPSAADVTQDRPPSIERPLSSIDLNPIAQPRLAKGRRSIMAVGLALCVAGVAAGLGAWLRHTPEHRVAESPALKPPPITVPAAAPVAVEDTAAAPLQAVETSAPPEPVPATAAHPTAGVEPLPESPRAAVHADLRAKEPRRARPLVIIKKPAAELAPPTATAEAAPTPVAASPAAPPPPAAEAKPQKGLVTIDVRNTSGHPMRAAVFVDGKDLHRLSPLKGLPLSAGHHTIEVRLATGAQSKDVEVEPDRTADVLFLGD